MLSATVQYCATTAIQRPLRLPKLLMLFKSTKHFVQMKTMLLVKFVVVAIAETLLLYNRSLLLQQFPSHAKSVNHFLQVSFNRLMPEYF